MKNLTLPGNPRYQPKDLQPHFGYDNLYLAVAEVEISTMHVLAEIGVIPKADIALLTPDVEAALFAITTTEVDVVEREITKHDIRAWVQLAKSLVHPRLRRWIHIPLTSYDVLETARIIQFVRAHKDVVMSLTDKVIRDFIEKILAFSDQVQIGRTHGQHALPITIGFWLATILNRILVNINSANIAAANLVGKISGPVGAYNAQLGLGISLRCGSVSFERRVLGRLGLKPARISTQILQPEPLSDYLFACLKLSATFGQFGCDGRNLMRTEIGELCEPFEPGQVGSSTMAHKRNPITFEKLQGTWQKTQIEFGKVLACLISEHQRDLVGSSLARDFPTIVVNLVSQLNTLTRQSGGRSFVSRISVDPVACKRNFDLQGDAILAEPIYIALQMAGYEGDAHKLVNHEAMPYARANKVSLLDATRTVFCAQSESTAEIWNNIPAETIDLLSKPEKYIGFAKERSLEIVIAANDYLAASRGR